MLALGELTTGMATPRDEGPLLDLINLVQPHVPWTRERLRWQFFDLPAGHAKLYVIRDGNAIVSLYAAIPHRLWIDGCQVEARMVQDVMTHPDFRGRGFLHHLGGLCLQEIMQSNAVGYTFPNDRSERSFRRGGWTELCEVPHRSKDLGDHSSARSELTVEPIENGFDERTDEIWEMAGFGVGVQRDREFLNWRYSKPDNTYYKFWIAQDRGLLVLKVYSDGDRRTVHILDLLTRQPDRDLIDDVLRFSVEFAAQHEAETITAWLPSGHPYATHFDAAGLVINPPHKRFVCVQCPAEFAPRVEDPVAWYFTQGDSDVY